MAGSRGARSLFGKALARISLAARRWWLLSSPKLDGADLPNSARGATIAFLERDRPDEPRAGDAYGDASIVPMADA